MHACMTEKARHQCVLAASQFYLTKDLCHMLKMTDSCPRSLRLRSPSATEPRTHVLAQNTPFALVLQNTWLLASRGLLPPLLS